MKEKKAEETRAKEAERQKVDEESKKRREQLKKEREEDKLKKQQKQLVPLISSSFLISYDLPHSRMLSQQSLILQRIDFLMS